LKWLEIRVSVASEDAATAVCQLFDLYGHGGAVQEQVFGGETQLGDDAPAPLTIKTYLPLNGKEMERRRTLQRGLSTLAERYGVTPPRYREVREDDWVAVWKAFFRPQRIGQHLVLKLPEQQYSAAQDDIVIDLEPGMAFGTGLHATTHTCLRCLEQLIPPGDRLLDMGTGSGVLAIAGARLGAGRVLALDNDPVAVGVARDNISLNGLTDFVDVREGSIEYLPDHREPAFDGIVVNIFAEVIVDMIKRGLASFLKPGGWLIASGILASLESEVRAVFRSCGLHDISRDQQEEWVTLWGVAEPTEASPAPGREEA
jgi:ribosomal protein L11 methyltransferase